MGSEEIASGLPSPAAEQEQEESKLPELAQNQVRIENESFQRYNTDANLATN